ncbi:MAG: hypothetical protein EA384_03375 [Spirochaetaceae bacterium]|nr:MAG: hypothetical protein EA384_03375 [Spirochaetaceae bacterium]
MYHSRRPAPGSVIVLLLLVATARGFAQQAVYEITAVDYHIEGRTRQFALETVVDLEPGLLFTSRDELEFFLADQQQLLINQRPLAEARLEYTARPVGPDRYAVEVDVHTRDSWNIIALPYFRYSSDDGLLLSLRGRDYNFFGTLERLAVNLDWENEKPGDGLTNVDELNLNWSFSWPFQWHGYDWRWDVKGELAYLPNDTDEYNFETALGITFPWLFGLDWTATYIQALDIRRGDKPDSDGLKPDTYWVTPGVRLGTTVPTGWMLGTLGEIRYNPRGTARYPYAPGLSEGRRGPIVDFTHSLSAGRVNWIGNFRDGTIAELTNSNELNLYRALGASNLEPWDRVVEAELRSYGAYLTDALFPVGLSARVGVFGDLDGSDQINDRVRGIIKRVDGEDRLRGEYGAYANVDLAVSVFRWGRFAEGQGAVFLDVGATGNLEDGLIDPDDILFGGGIEIFGFPLFSRALYLRASLGFDLRAVVDETTLRGSEKRDIFIGLDHHY